MGQVLSPEQQLPRGGTWEGFSGNFLSPWEGEVRPEPWGERVSGGVGWGERVSRPVRRPGWGRRAGPAALPLLLPEAKPAQRSEDAGRPGPD